MKKIILILMVGSLFAATTENIDVIKQYDGTIYKGKIIEQNIKEEGWVKIEIAGGSVIHITKDKIESIESEERELEQVQKKWRPDFWFYLTIMVIVEAIL